MWEFIAGCIAGAGGVMVKDHLMPNTDIEKLKNQLNEVLTENEKYRSKNKELERLVEDLQSEKMHLKKQSQNNEDAHDDLVDDLDAEKRKNKRLSTQVSDLTAQIEEYKSALQSLEEELKHYKK